MQTGMLFLVTKKTFFSNEKYIQKFNKKNLLGDLLSR